MEQPKAAPGNFIALFVSFILSILATAGFTRQQSLVLNEQEYFEMPGLNVML